MDIDTILTPEWASRHCYYHHSNPRSKDRAKTFFEKSHVRPLLNWARKKRRGKYSTDEELIKADRIIRKFSCGTDAARMAAGRIVQEACDLVLIDSDTEQRLSVQEAICNATSQYAKYQPQMYTKTAYERDTAQHAVCAEAMPEIIDNAIAGLREAMATDNRIIGEEDLLGKLPGNKLPHFTKPDYGRRGDLKTKWPTPDDSERGYKITSLPSNLNGMFDINNVFQCAGFWALNNQQAPFLVYAGLRTKKNNDGYKVFTPNNAEQLQDEYLKAVVNKIRLYHRTTENMLFSANNKKELMGLVSPDFDKIYWQQPPDYIHEAEIMWELRPGTLETICEEELT